MKVGYVVENPIWKTSYRLVLDKKGKPFLQGWAVVENTSDDDWKDVRMVLVSGRPISFQMDLYQPLFIPRPTVEPELFASLRPPTYQRALTNPGQAGSPAALGRLPGRSASRRELGGLEAAIAANPATQHFQQRTARQLGQLAATRRCRRAHGDQNDFHNGNNDNNFDNNKLSYEELQQRRQQQRAGQGERQEPRQRPGRHRPQARRRLGRRRRGGRRLLPVRHRPQGHAAAAEVGHAADRQRARSRRRAVSIYNESVQSKFPLLGLRFKNTSGQNLMQGPITVYEGGTYAGDARILDLQPNEERLVAYAVDQGTEVKCEAAERPGAARSR